MLRDALEPGGMQAVARMWPETVSRGLRSSIEATCRDPLPSMSHLEQVLNAIEAYCLTDPAQLTGSDKRLRAAVDLWVQSVPQKRKSCAGSAAAELG